MRIKITKTNHSQDYHKVTPDFIYNRYDLFCTKHEFEALKLKSNNTEKIIEVKYNQDKAELGIWLTPITQDELEHILYYINKNHPEIKTVQYKNSLLSYGKSRRSNHFRIVFPKTKEEMIQTVSGISRKKLRKKLRLAEEKYGSMTIEEYESPNIPEEIVKAFFEFKFAIRNRVYNMSPQEYLDRYHVSHCYVFRFNDKIGAIRFSCEQCPIIYGENFTYNPEFKDYSLGTIIFFYHLIRCTEKGHQQLFFAGGEFEYKKHYGSIEEELYDCTIQLKDVDFTRFIEETFEYKWNHFIHTQIPDFLKRVSIKSYIKQLQSSIESKLHKRNTTKKRLTFKQYIKKHFPNVCKKLNIK